MYCYFGWKYHARDEKMFTIQLPSLCRRSFQWALSAISKSIIHFIVCKYICGFDFSLSSFFFGLPNTNFLKPKRHSNTHSQTQTFYSWCEFRSNSCVFFLFISLNYAFFLLVFIQHQLDYITKSGKLKSKIKTYQIWKYRIACTGLVIYFEFKAKKPANSNENFNAIKQKKKFSVKCYFITDPTSNELYLCINLMNEE